MLDFLGEKWNKAAVDAMNDIDDFVQIISLGPKMARPGGSQNENLKKTTSPKPQNLEA